MKKDNILLRYKIAGNGNHLLVVYCITWLLGRVGGWVAGWMEK
jgi:hypothetical protein